MSNKPLSIDTNNFKIGSGKSHLITRTGNKTNDIKHFIDLLPSDVKNVVEPFGGSFAVIRDVYFDNKYKKYVNDLDDILYYIYKNPNELVEGYKKWNKIHEMNTGVVNKKQMLENLKINKNIKEYIKNGQIVRGTITQNKNLDNIDDDINFMKSINFSNDDAFKIIEKFRKNKDTFIFLDPPYLFSNNSSYLPQLNSTDMTEYYLKFLKILDDKTTKAKIMLIVNDLNILRELYKKYLVKTYDRIYQIGKKKAKHIIMTNYTSKNNKEGGYKKGFKYPPNKHWTAILKDLIKKENYKGTWKQAIEELYKPYIYSNRKATKLKKV